MAETRSPRMAVARYSAGTDSFSRADFDESMQRIEERTAIYLQGTRAARPAAGTVGRYYAATDEKSHWYDDGTTWWSLGAYSETGVVKAGASGSIALSVRGATGQTAVLQEWRSGSNTQVATLSNAGVMTADSFSGDHSGDSASFTTATVTTLSTTTASASASMTSPLFQGNAVRDGGTGKAVRISDTGLSNIDNLIAPGAIMVWPLAAVPDAGWVFAQGQLLLRASYPALFDRYGTTFNTGGELATQFRVPDLRGVSIVGANGTYPLNATGGSATTTIASGHLPPHTHTIAAHTHTMTHTHQHDHSHTIAHTHTIADHQHSINHTHAAVTSGTDSPDHSHEQQIDNSYNPATGGIAGHYASNNSGNNPAGSNMNTGGANQRHAHIVQVPAYVGTSGLAGATTTSGTSTASSGGASVTTTGGSSAANTGSDGDGNTGNGPGSSSPLNVMNPWRGMNWIIKV